MYKYCFSRLANEFSIHPYLKLSMDNSTTPPLTGDVLLVTQLELVTPTTVAAALYGIAFTLFCLYVHALAPRLRNGDRTKQARFMLAYSSVIMLCGLYFLVANAWVTQDAYIKHSDYPGGPYAYVLSTFHSTTAVIPIGLTCQTVIDVMTSAIQVRGRFSCVYANRLLNSGKVWRVWVIWSASKYANLVTVLPLLCFLTFTGIIFLRGLPLSKS
jgi:hypothetical protein